jgi:hypothetical protein
VKTTWKPNITLFDKYYHEPHPVHNPRQSGYAEYPNSPFEIPKVLESFLHFAGLGKRESKKKEDKQPDAPTYSHISRFVDALVEAIKGLNGRFVIELRLGDLMQELAKLRYEARPPGYPRTFTRAWLSNIP